MIKLEKKPGKKKSIIGENDDEDILNFIFGIKKDEAKPLNMGNDFNLFPEEKDEALTLFFEDLEEDIKKDEDKIFNQEIDLNLFPENKEEELTLFPEDSGDDLKDDLDKTFSLIFEEENTLKKSPIPSVHSVSFMSEGGEGKEWKERDIIKGIYEVTKILGEGAFGSVYKVRHRAWNKDLAVKSLKTELAEKESHKKSFVNECEGWVNLGLHPNIVTCYYVREIHGLPRIFLEYVEGGSLSDYLKKEERTDLKEIIDLSIQCLDGLSFSHKKGVIHRDIKPLNCLLTSGGLLKITDFGIASGLTKVNIIPSANTGAEETGIFSGGAVGTPAYMPPEQWDRRYGKIGPWSDIYALGVMLYKMCCRKGPFSEKGMPPLVIKARHLTFDPENPSRINSLIPESLSAFILKCLAKKPEERFLSCGEARAELENIYREITGYSYDRKEPEEVDLLADSLNNRAVSLLDLGKKEEALNIWEESLKKDIYHVKSVFNRGLIKYHSGLSDDITVIKDFFHLQSELRKNPDIHYFTGLFHLERDDCKSAVEAFEKALECSPENDEIKKMLAGAKEKEGASNRLLKTIDTGSSSVSLYSFTEDSKRALIMDRKLKILDLIQSKWENMGEAFPVTAACTLKNFILTGHHRADSLTLRDIFIGRILRKITIPNDSIKAVDMKDNFAVAGGAGGVIHVIDISRGRALMTLRGHRGEIISLKITDNRYILSGSSEGVVKIWHLATGKCEKTIDTGNKCDIIKFTGEGDLFAAVRNYLKDGSYYEIVNEAGLWNIKTGQCVNSFSISDGEKILSADLQNSWLLAGGESQTVNLIKLPEGRCVRTFKGSHKSPVGHVLLSKDIKFALSSDWNGKINIWNINTERFNKKSSPVLSEIKRTEAMRESQKLQKDLLSEAKEAIQDKKWAEAINIVRELRKEPDYEKAPEVLNFWRSLYGYGKKAELKAIWLHRTLEGHDKWINSAEFSNDGKYIVSGSKDGTIKIWDTCKGVCIKTIKDNWGEVHSVDISSDFNFILAGYSDSNVRLFDAVSGNFIKTFEDRKTGIIETIALSSHKKFFISAGSWDNKVKLWDINSGQEMKNFEIADGSNIKALLSPQDKYIISLSYQRTSMRTGGYYGDKTIKLWEVNTGKCLKTIEGPPGGFMSADISSDGSYVFSGSSDNRVRLWDLTSAVSLKTLDQSYKHGVKSVSLSSDNRWGVSSAGFAFNIWDLNRGKCIKTVEEHKGIIETVCFSNDMAYLLTGSQDKTIKVWFLDWELK